MVLRFRLVVCSVVFLSSTSAFAPSILAVRSRYDLSASNLAAMKQEDDSEANDRLQNLRQFAVTAAIAASLIATPFPALADGRFVSKEF